MGFAPEIQTLQHDTERPIGAGPPHFLLVGQPFRETLQDYVGQGALEMMKDGARSSYLGKAEQQSSNSRHTQQS